MPEKVFKKLNKSILPQWKVSFIAALVVGLLAHFYKITNWLPNWDSLVFRYDPQNMIAIGKENLAASNLSDAPVRWIVDDCLKFVQREIPPRRTER